jgi:hypothetical protein
MNGQTGLTGRDQKFGLPEQKLIVKVNGSDMGLIG